MRYRLLGPLEVCGDHRSLPLGGYRQRLVLALLLSRPGQECRTDWLVDALWGEHPPRTARDGEVRPVPDPGRDHRLVTSSVTWPGPWTPSGPAGPSLASLQEEP